MHSKMEQYHINVDFWSQTRINKIKQPKELSLPNSEPERVRILVKQFSTGTANAKYRCQLSTLFSILKY